MKNITRSFSKKVYKKIIKPLLFKVSPDTVHAQIISLGALLQQHKIIRKLLAISWAEHDIIYAKTVAGVRFLNPIGISAGFDKNGKLVPLLESIGCGYVTVGSVTALPRTGNPKPWFHRLPKTKSLVVHAGMPNDGVEKVVKNLEQNKRHSTGAVPVIFSVAVVARSAAHTPEDAIRDALETIKRVEQDKGLVDILEINISCPNIMYEQPFTTPEVFETLLIAIDKAAPKLPIFIKMPSTRWEKLEALLDVANKYPVVKGVSIANLTSRRDITIKDDFDNTIHGGLSGRPCLSRSNELIQRARSKYKNRFAIIGIGGVFSYEDAKAKIDAGADLVGLITGMIFEGPQLIGDINYHLLKSHKKSFK